MKILFLNPHIDAQHQLVTTLRSKNNAILLPESADEAWQILQIHGKSIELAIVHKESSEPTQPDSGLGFIQKVKNDANQADLPIILTSDKWNTADFSTHQNSPLGVHAYLPWPSDEATVLQTIQEMFSDVAEASDLSSPSTSEPSLAFDGVEKEVSSVSMAELSLAGLEVPKAFVSATQSAISAASQHSLPLDSLEIPTEDIPHELPSEEIAPSVAEAPAEPSSEELDRAILSEMPYLFTQKSPSEIHKAASIPQRAAQAMMMSPLGNAIIPGGAGNNPDIDTLKKYLGLREQDVSVLSSQLQAAQDLIGKMEAELREEQAKNSELSSRCTSLQERVGHFEREKSLAVESVQGDLENIRFEMKTKIDKAKILESQVREANEEMNRLKERVRSDIRKIRVREKELENKLEITRRDSEVLISAREGKIIELKRKLDILEFNMDLLQDQYSKEKESNSSLRERLSRAAQVVRVAGGFLETQGIAVPKLDVEEGLSTESSATRKAG